MGGRKKTDNAAPASARWDWSDLRVFLHVAEAQSLSGAAKSLGVSQPTVTQRMQAFEDRLKTRLFVRSAQGVSLTEAGAKILEQARSMERVAQSVDRLVRERDTVPEGRVKLAAPDGIAGFWIAPRLPEFFRLNPDITLSIDAGFWPDDPVRDELDVSLQYDTTNLGEFVVQPIATLHYAPFATRRYLELYGTPKSLADLLRHRVIAHSAVRFQPDTWDPKMSAVRTLADSALDTNCSATIIMAAQAGAAIAQLPTCAVRFMPDLVMLSEVPIASPKLYLVYRADVGRIVRVRRVIDWIKTMFDSQENPWFRSEFIHPREFAPPGFTPCALGERALGDDADGAQIARGKTTS
jgi:DNA-binding transcriptional LysR family regulator